jgi:hypothetical protein
VVHSALLISRNPFPLHEFKPLQLLVAVLQELSPLHELAPMHLPFMLPACAAMGAVASIAAAAIAMATPVVFFTLIIIRKSSFVWGMSKYCVKCSQKYHGFTGYPGNGNNPACDRGYSVCHILVKSWNH